MTKRISDLLLKKLAINKLDALLISSPCNISYLTSYSGFSTIEREAFLLITNGKQYILTDGRYTEEIKKIVSSFSLLEISSKFSLTDWLQKISKEQHLSAIGIEEDNLTVFEYKKISKCFKSIKHCSISELRIIKETTEIEHIQNACKIGDWAFVYILTKIKEGITEKELAFELEYYIKKQGAELSFPSIVAFGENSSVPHHQTSNTKLKKNEFVLLDFGVKIQNYCSDMTRTIVFGKPSTEQKKIHQTVLDAQQKAIDLLNSKSKPILASDIDKGARDYIIFHGYPAIPHSLGHGIGLEVHEAPRLSPKSKDILKNGMVFSIEPGIYTPNFGGVRIEDLVVLENNKVRLLTKSSKELIHLN